MENYNLDSDNHLARLIDDTDDILASCREISYLLEEKFKNKPNTLFKLGKQIVNARTDSPQSGQNLGNASVKFII